MKLTKSNFCPNIKDESTAIRICYVCEKTEKICPRVNYSSGEALPDRFFEHNGCSLLVKDTSAKEKKIEKSVKKVVSDNNVENKSPKSKPKTNSKKKKTTNKKK